MFPIEILEFSEESDQTEVWMIRLLNMNIYVINKSNNKKSLMDNFLEYISKYNLWMNIIYVCILRLQLLLLRLKGVIQTPQLTATYYENNDAGLVVYFALSSALCWTEGIKLSKLVQKIKHNLGHRSLPE